MRPAAERRRTEWEMSDEVSGLVLAFPGERLRRFVAVQMVRPNHWRAAVFVGWHLDPAFPPDRHFATFAEALNRAAKGAGKMGLPLVRDRCSMLGHGVWNAPA